MSNKLSLNQFEILSGSVLKVIAVIAMLIDHAALLIGPELDFMTHSFFSIGDKSISIYYIMRRIGRLAFPIFCFLITEGFLHTKNRKRYGISLLIFALISEIPFNMMMGGKPINLGKQNVFFTLFLGFLLMYIYDNVKGEFKKFVLMLPVVVVAMYLKADYGLLGVLLVLVIYILRERPAIQAVISYPLLSGGPWAFLAFAPINMYNGQRGFIKSPILKYGFYAFYPLHIMVLVIVKLILRQ